MRMDLNSLQPIHFVCLHGHKKLLCELIDQYGVDPHVKDEVSIIISYSLSIMLNYRYVDVYIYNYFFYKYTIYTIMNIALNVCGII